MWYGTDLESIIYDKLQATDFSVIMENEDQVEVSFSKRWSTSMDAVPLNVDKDDPPVGFWMITPSNEFRVGGPTKQDLTSHVGPTVLNSIETESHGKSSCPAYVYLNSISPSEDPEALWEDAKEQMSTEVRSWPYNFPQSEDFPSSHQRGNVLGQLIVRDRYINERLMHASFAYVGLAAPGDVGSWQMEAKGYQFWTQADRKGIFSINNVRAGNYSLYAWVPGIIGDYKYNVNIIIEPRSKIKLGVLVYDPPRNGPTLWEIGIPDRTASEFYVPDTYPTLMNKLYTNHPTDKFRQYGLWERYADIEMGNKTYEATTWQIIFELESVSQSGNYTIQVALASAHMSELQGNRRQDVKIKVLYCGICHSDLHGIKNDWGISIYPLLPGHEIVGIATEVGSNVEKFKVGDKVGVGCMVGSCGSCNDCTNNLENYCPKIIATYNGIDDDGAITYGGYSDFIIVDQHFVIRYPESLPLDAGAPLLCAGITVYSPLKYYGLDKPGMKLGVVGLGGLGHMAVKFAKAMGLKVTVISTSPNKKRLLNILAAMGTLDGVIDTVSVFHAVLPIIGLLKSHGKLVLLGLPDKPLELPVFPLLLGRKTVAGSVIGGIKETQEMIDLAAKHNITADVEVISIDYVNKAMERLARADVKYRFVIDIANTLAAGV
ncbi:hypothetical protein GH714_042361 [Hevea brasiliensis]|uniref:Enoyl reductase (ER) domain-containing protein n=1 Tax=Hevea brasiliensis TaxID=3981 RepID=A0A6A6KCU6_HEVBR|nr:hypothetical protein GH714_042361 [Hevea brasiliensis]